MVTLKDVFKQLIRDVKSEKLRTLLTVFGIVWGTVAISLMLAFGTGLHKQLVKNTVDEKAVVAYPWMVRLTNGGVNIDGKQIRKPDRNSSSAMSGVGSGGSSGNSVRCEI